MAAYYVFFQKRYLIIAQVEDQSFMVEKLGIIYQSHRANIFVLF